jgi:hypothetical protein
MAFVMPDEMLARVAGVLRQTVGPGVGDDFARTQAYMAAVVLEKLARQVRSDQARQRANASDEAVLFRDLEEMLGADAPPSVQAVLDTAEGASDARLGSLVGALYAERAALGAERFAAALARVRKTLRSRLDRELEYSA